MKTRTEIWPIAVDKIGVWLLAADAWRTGEPIQADSDAHADVLLELARHGLALGDLLEIHSTSWRHDGPSILLTYYAAVDCDGPVLEHWPHAQPIALDAAQAVGRAPSHGGLEAPAPRDVDVLLHALRHLRWRLDTDADAIATYADRPLWRQHLATLAPALAEMYGVPASQQRAA